MCKVMEEVNIRRELALAGLMGINEFSSILLDKLDELGCDADVYIADNDCRVYRKDMVIDFLKLDKLDETDSLEYVAEDMDCDDFARHLFGKGVPLVWTNLHALSWFIDIDEKCVYFIEPQTDKISKNLDGWQGNEIRFFINV